MAYLRALDWGGNSADVMSSFRKDKLLKTAEFRVSLACSTSLVLCFNFSKFIISNLNQILFAKSLCFPYPTKKFAPISQEFKVKTKNVVEGKLIRPLFIIVSPCK